MARGIRWGVRLSALAVLVVTLCALWDKLPNQPSISNHQYLEKDRSLQTGSPISAAGPREIDRIVCYLATTRFALQPGLETTVAFDSLFRWRLAGNSSPPLS